RDLVRATAHAALDGLAGAARVGSPREHGVLAGDPAAALALHPARHALRERGGAEDARAAELDEDAALRVVQPVAGDAHFAQQVGGSAVEAGVVGHCGFLPSGMSQWAPG